jgi:hypothetical protein
MLSSFRGFRRRKFAPAVKTSVYSRACVTQAKITTLLFEVPLRIDSLMRSAPGTSESTKAPSVFRRFRQSRAASAVGTRINLAPYFLTPLDTAFIVA